MRSILKRIKLIRWAANPSDRREKLLALSEHGQQLLRNLTSLHRNQVLAVGPTFVQALGAILSSFEDETSSSSGSKVG
jgi:DNA-binding MarR family transcriptional regulator